MQTRIATGLAVCVLVGISARADFSNGDFSAGLLGWTSQSDVSAVAETAALGDDDAAVSAIYQPVPWPVGSFTMQFDFRADLSDDTPQGTFPDAAFFSLYFADDPLTFDPDNPGSFDHSVGLMDLDASGQFVLTGTVTPGQQGADWYHYSISMQNTSGYIIPYIELHDLNQLNNDSRVYVDNFSLVVPEPATAALFGVGGLLILARARRRQRRPTSTP